MTGFEHPHHEARVVVLGGPRTGKSTAALSIGGRWDWPVHCTDSLVATHDWSRASEAAAAWLDRPGPWVVEGVAAVRALRKWLLRTRAGRPCDRVYFAFEPLFPLTPGQDAMRKGCQTVWGEIWPSLAARGVLVSPLARRPGGAVRTPSF